MTEMPRSVAWFERLMYLSLIIGAAGFLLHPPAPTKRYIAEHGIIPFVFGSAIVFGLYARLIGSVARRRKNWVRWMLLILFVGNLLWIPKSVVQAYHEDPVTALNNAAGLLIHGLAFCFVFSADARPWFQKPNQLIPTSSHD